MADKDDIREGKDFGIGVPQVNKPFHVKGAGALDWGMQNRLARILASGRGLPVDKVGAARWHIIARSQGVSDTWMESFMAQLSTAEREDAEKKAKFWIAFAGISRS